MSTQQAIDDLYKRTVSGMDSFTEYDLQTLKLDFINQDFKNGNSSEKELVQTVRYALWNQNNIILMTKLFGDVILSILSYPIG